MSFCSPGGSMSKAERRLLIPLEFGMNAEVGQLAVTDVTGNRGSDGPLSAQAAGQARIIVDEQMQKALALLKEKESDLNALATELLRKNRLTRDEIKAIIGK